MREVLVASLLAMHLACMAQAPSLPSIGSTDRPVLAESNVAAISDINENRDHLINRLQLNNAQRELWYTFEVRLDAYSKLLYGEKPAAAFASEPVPRQFKHLTDSVQNRLAALEEIEEAAQNLYATLDAEQQKIASQSLMSMIPALTPMANCAPTDSKIRTDKRDSPQRSRRGGTSSGGHGEVG